MYQLVRTSMTMNTYFVWSVRHLRNQIFHKPKTPVNFGVWGAIETKTYCKNIDQTKKRKWWYGKPFAFRLLAILSLPFGLSFVVIAQWRQYQKFIKDKLCEKTDWQVYCYCTLPLRFVSRCWGVLAETYVPKFMRPLVYGTYIRLFDVNLAEAKQPDLYYYNTLSDFFVRELNAHARVIDRDCCLVSACDGTILNFGPVESDYIDQVKGQKYSLQCFLGENTWPEDECNVKLNLINNDANQSNRLYQCVIYLAPGDYHRFHSPTEWTPKYRRHFAGQLLSVNPSIASWIPNLFTINERVAYYGKWRHGFFSLTAVGATNVGKIRIYHDDELQTNKFFMQHSHFHDMHLPKRISFERGDLIGEFRMGSTIVLIFEAPINFKFNVNLGQKIQMGQALGQVPSNTTLTN